MNTALIFAAGRGLRLRPLTDTHPKPLCTINDVALIDYHLKQLTQSNITRVLINHAYLGDQIKRHIQAASYPNLEIVYLPEPPGGFHTGGTVINALPTLRKEPFLAINADIFTDYTLRHLTLPKNSLAHLVLVQTPKTHAHPDFGLSAQNKLSNLDKQYIFSGMACYHPDFFKEKPRGRASLIPWLQEAADKHLATGEVHAGMWFDTGSPERLTKARLAASKS